MKDNFNRNRNIIIFAICLLFVCVGNITSQTSVPDPSVYLAFDTDNPAYESISKYPGLVSGSFRRVEDRFGNYDRAVAFIGKGSGVGLIESSINAVHTVSLWVFISDPSEIPSGSTPFSPESTKYEFYNWVNSDNQSIKGLGRKGATIGFNRYIPKQDGTIEPWYLWSYKPAQFDQVGWYHIFVVHGMYYTRLVMYKPDSQKAYSYIWMGNQSFPANRYLFVGGNAGTNPINGFLDDFKIYNEELTDDQISFLHTAEYPENVFLRIKNKTTGKYAVVYEASKDNDAQIIQHSGGMGNDEWALVFTGTNECRIRNLHSLKNMVVKDASREVGAEVIQYDHGGLDNEIWILEYLSDDINHFYLKNQHSGKYLGVFQNSSLDNYKLIQVNSGESTIVWGFEESLPNQMSRIEPGLYRLKNKKSGLYLDILDRNQNKGASLIQHRKHNSDDAGYDIWNFSPVEIQQDGYYIINSVTYFFMTAPDSYPRNTQIIQKDITEAGTSRWQLLPTSIDGEYRVRNVDNYMYAVVEGASTEEGASIILAPPGSEDNEIWQLERVYYSDSPISSGTYKIRNDNSYKMMVVRDASIADGADIIQYSTGEENSLWEITPDLYGYVTLRNKNSLKYLVVKDGSLAEDTELIQYGTHDSNGLWKIDKVLVTEGGVYKVAYTLRSLCSELMMVVRDASTDDGASIIQYSTGEKNKLWHFEKQSSNTLTRSVEEQTTIQSDLEKPIVVVDCKNDIILVEYPFATSTELIVQIVDLTGRKVFDEKKRVEAGSGIASITQFDNTLSANQFYVISIRSTDGKIRFTTKAIMN
jgi:hypothetical protein